MRWGGDGVRWRSKRGGVQIEVHLQVSLVAPIGHIT